MVSTIILYVIFSKIDYGQNLSGYKVHRRNTKVGKFSGEVDEYKDWRYFGRTGGLKQYFSCKNGK